MRTPTDWQVIRFDTAWLPTTLYDLLSRGRSPTLASAFESARDNDRYGLRLIDVPHGEYVRAGGNFLSPSPYVRWSTAALLDLEKSCEQGRYALFWIQPDVRFVPGAAKALSPFVPASKEYVPDIVTAREFLMMADNAR